jgi:hypothetical protein
MPGMSVVDDLERCFPGYRSPERAAAWNAAKAQLPNDSSVTGVVVAKYPFGVFVDIGVGFPALLEIIFIDGMTPEQYRDGKWSPTGSSLTAFIRWPEIEDGSRQIGLWQIRGERSFQS